MFKAGRTYRAKNSESTFECISATQKTAVFKTRSGSFSVKGQHRFELHEEIDSGFSIKKLIYSILG